jgi:hypothetical protein
VGEEEEGGEWRRKRIGRGVRSGGGIGQVYTEKGKRKGKG